jgi:hypothetical protein
VRFDGMNDLARLSWIRFPPCGITSEKMLDLLGSPLPAGSDVRLKNAFRVTDRPDSRIRWIRLIQNYLAIESLAASESESWLGIGSDFE